MFSIKKAIKNVVRYQDGKVKEFENKIDNYIRDESFCGRNYILVCYPKIEKDKIDKVLNKYSKDGYKVSDYKGDIKIEW